MANGGEVIFKFLGDDSALSKTMKAVGGIGKATLGALVAGTTAVATGFATIVKSSVEARGELEQLEGGVKKLFGSSADTVTQYANEAYKTIGISANQYMEQVTSFSASLISSLGGDTEKASKTADRAMRDMADNANTFGSSIESIQRAYQGFAKDNYTMLDNLKLGYGGTKTEMERLIKDASKMKDVQKELNIEVKDGDMSFANITNAISVVQSQMGIMGTTEKEAMDTLTGSIGMLKASWENFLSGSGNLGQVVESAGKAFDNIMRIVNEAMPQITEQIVKYMPQLIETGVNLVGAIGNGIIQNLPQLMNTAGTIIKGIGSTLGNNMDTILDKGIEIIISMINGISNALPELVPKAIEIIGKIASTIIRHLPEISDAGIRLVIKLGEGMIRAIPNIIFQTLNIANTIKNSIFDLIRQAPGWGIDMIRGFANGIMGALGELQSRVESVANSIRSRLHFSRPDIGPLRDYETWMPDMIKGMAKSLERAMPILDEEIAKLSMNLSPTLNGNVNNTSPGVKVSVYNSYETDPLGQIVSKIKTFSNGAKNDYNYGYGG